MDKIKVLLVEDEATLAMIVQETLSSEGFDVDVAGDGVEGLEKAASQAYDALVVDIMMPKMDGFEMVKRVRMYDKITPVLFLTARSAINDVVEGFGIGGDDYLKKPFSMLELIVRIRALVQRASLSRVKEEKGSAQSEEVMIGQYVLNTVTQMLSRYGQAEELSSREVQILQMLARSEKEVVNTKDILMEVWGDDSLYNGRSLQVFITKLRHKLSKDPSVRIINVRGIGYKLI